MRIDTGAGYVASSHGAAPKFQTQFQTQWQLSSAPASSEGSQVNISDAAQKLLAESASASEAQDIQNKLDAIKAKPAVQRTAEDTAFLNGNDQRLIDIRTSGKGPDQLSADDLDYMQKAGGFVNTFANLSPQEKQLYDEFVAAGNQEAAQGLRNIALAREGMQGSVTLPDGRSFDPENTELTGDNVRNLYRFMFADADSDTVRVFDALAAALDLRQEQA